jgi:hypothetical protein
MTTTWSGLATSYQLLQVIPLHLLPTTMAMVVNFIVPSLTCFDDLNVSVQYQLGTKTIMSRDAFEGGGMMLWMHDVHDAFHAWLAANDCCWLLS